MGPTRKPPEPIPAWADDQQQRLERLIPDGWRVWFIRHSWGTSWHAAPPGANRAAVTSDTPDGLLNLITKPGAWLDEAIGHTRKAMDEMPEHWTFERGALQIQLDSLLAERARRDAE